MAKAKRAPTEVASVTIKSRVAASKPKYDKLYFDNSCAILSRQFENDRDRCIQRAIDGEVSAMVCWCSDLDKLEKLLAYCQLNAKYCYFIAGIHPDNIERTNKKLHDSWVEKIENSAKHGECVGILTGLNMTREMGTHFSQESIFKQSCAIATKLHMPIVLHINDAASLDKCVELLLEEGYGRGEQREDEYQQRFVLHDVIKACHLDADKLKNVLEQIDFHCEFTALGFCDSSSTTATIIKATACLNTVPLERIVIGSDGPWRTPQNLPDVHCRTLKNESSNLSSIYEVIVSAWIEGSSQREVVAKTITSNSFKIYGGSSWLLQEEGVSAADTTVSGEALIVEDFKPESYSVIEVEDLTTKSHVEIIGALPESVPPNATYSCHRCRSFLFTPHDTITHDLEAFKRSIIFKDSNGSTSSGTGQCTAALFIACESADKTSYYKLPQNSKKHKHKKGDLPEDFDSLQLQDDRETPATTLRTISRKCNLRLIENALSSVVECPSCSAKLGRISLTETPCPCGILIPGPCLKILTSKVDFIDHQDVDLDVLVERSKNETIRVIEDAENIGNKVMESSKPRKKKTKMEKSDNKGNFSNYRNKTFVPNASRKKATDTSMLTSQGPNQEEEDEEESVCDFSDEDIDLPNGNDKSKKNRRSANKSTKMSSKFRADDGESSDEET